MDFKHILHTAARCKGLDTFEGHMLFVCDGSFCARDKIVLRLHYVDRLSSQEYAALVHEAYILRQLNHLNILCPISFQSFDDLCVTIFPFYSCGSLKYRLINQFNFGLCETAALYVLVQILQALEYLHSHFYLHRGVKCYNILLCGKDYKVLLAGFENAVGTVNHGFKVTSLHDFNGKMKSNLNWIAPEVLHQGHVGYTAKADIYMLGITIIEMCNGVEPYFNFQPYKTMLEKYADNKPMLVDKHTDGLINEVTYPLRPNESLPMELTAKDYSRDLHRLTADCIKFDPQQRPTISELTSKYHRLLEHGKHFKGEECKQLFDGSNLCVEPCSLNETDPIDVACEATNYWEF